MNDRWEKDGISEAMENERSDWMEKWGEGRKGREMEGEIEFKIWMEYRKDT